MSTKKLQELILHIATQSSDDPYFGATKLNKILFFADFLAYGYWGKPITGVTYIHWDRGPIPKDYLAVQHEMETQGRMVIKEEERFGYKQHRLVPLVNADLSLFSREELALVDEVISKFEPLNGTELSELTHELRPWLDTVKGEEIPYYTVFVMKGVPVTMEAKRKARERLEERRAAGDAV